MPPHADETPPPGSPEARKLGCVCSPNQNRNGAGVYRPPFGVMFAVLYRCPLHGNEKLTGAVRSEAELC